MRHVKASILQMSVMLFGALLLILLTQEPAQSSSRLYVSNNLTGGASGGRVLEFDGNTGQFISQLGSVTTPRELEIGSDGSLYVTSTNANSIQNFAFNNGVQQSTFVASGAGGLQFPEGLAIGPDGNLYVTSGSSSTNVFRFDGSSGNFLNVFAGVASGTASHLEFGPNGNLFAGTLFSGVVQFNGQTGASLGTFVPAAHFHFVGGMTFGPDHNLYVATASDDSVLRFNGSTGAFIDTFISPGSGGLNDAEGLAFGPDGNLYVAGLINDAILRYNGTTGAFMNVFASAPIDAPTALVFSVPEPKPLALVSTAIPVLLLFQNCRKRSRLRGPVTSVG
jgi:DNA-binding beta-propeller fold protein YncE